MKHRSLPSVLALFSPAAGKAERLPRPSPPSPTRRDHLPSRPTRTRTRTRSPSPQRFATATNLEAKASSTSGSGPPPPPPRRRSLSPSPHSQRPTTTGTCNNTNLSEQLPRSTSSSSSLTKLEPLKEDPTPPATPFFMAPLSSESSDFYGGASSLPITAKTVQGLFWERGTPGGTPRLITGPNETVRCPFFSPRVYEKRPEAEEKRIIVSVWPSVVVDGASKGEGREEGRPHAADAAVLRGGGEEAVEKASEERALAISALDKCSPCATPVQDMCSSCVTEDRPGSVDHAESRASATTHYFSIQPGTPGSGSCADREAANQGSPHSSFFDLDFQTEDGLCGVGGASRSAELANSGAAGRFSLDGDVGGEDMEEFEGKRKGEPLVGGLKAAEAARPPRGRDRRRREVGTEGRRRARRKEKREKVSLRALIARAIEIQQSTSGVILPKWLEAGERVTRHSPSAVNSSSVIIPCEPFPGENARVDALIEEVVNPLAQVVLSQRAELAGSLEAVAEACEWAQQLTVERDELFKLLREEEERSGAQTSIAENAVRELENMVGWSVELKETLELGNRQCALRESVIRSLALDNSELSSNNLELLANEGEMLSQNKALWATTQDLLKRNTALHAHINHLTVETQRQQAVLDQVQKEKAMLLQAILQEGPDAVIAWTRNNITSTSPFWQPGWEARWPRGEREASCIAENSGTDRPQLSHREEERIQEGLNKELVDVKDVHLKRIENWEVPAIEEVDVGGPPKDSGTGCELSAEEKEMEKDLKFVDSSRFDIGGDVRSAWEDMVAIAEEIMVGSDGDLFGLDLEGLRETAGLSGGFGDEGLQDVAGTLLEERVKGVAVQGLERGKVRQSSYEAEAIIGSEEEVASAGADKTRGCSDGPVENGGTHVTGKKGQVADEVPRLEVPPSLEGGSDKGPFVRGEASAEAPEVGGHRTRDKTVLPLLELESNVEPVDKSIIQGSFMFPLLRNQRVGAIAMRR